MKKILVVEDEKNILRVIRDGLENAGFTVLAAKDGPTGYTLALKETIDCLILDVMLPGMDGFEVCAKLRRKKPALPIIMLTARSAEADKLQGLGLGVDDYMTKPFSIKELVARVQNRLIRAKAVQAARPDVGETFAFGKIRLDFVKMEAWKGREAIELTKKEYDILRYMIAHSGEVVSRDDLLNNVWGFEEAPYTRTVDTFIARLRKKIEDDPADPKHLVSIRDAGYKLIV